MRWPLQPLQPFQQTQLQPPFGQSVDSLCHPWFTTTNVSYRFPILKLPPPPCAVLLVGLLFLKCLLDTAQTTQTTLGYVRTIHVWEFNMKEALVRLLELHACSNFSTNYSVDDRICRFWMTRNECFNLLVCDSLGLDLKSTQLRFNSVAKRIQISITFSLSTLTLTNDTLIN